MRRAIGSDGTSAYLRTRLADALLATGRLDEARDELEAALRPQGTVLLGCDAECYLTQVAFCLGRDASGAPTGPTACPRSASAVRVGLNGR